MMDSPGRKHYLMQAFRRNRLEQHLHRLLVDIAQELAPGLPGDQDAGERRRGAGPATVVAVEQLDHVQPGTLAQAQVRNDYVGWLHPLVNRFHRLLGIFGRHHLAAPTAQQVADAGEDARFVVDHQDAHADDVAGNARFRSGRRGGFHDAGLDFRQGDREHRALARTGPHRGPSSQQPGKALHGGQAQAEATPGALRPSGLGAAFHAIELVEDVLQVFLADAQARVPDVHANEPVVLAPRTHQYAAAARVAQGVADEVVEDAGEHRAVRANPQPGRAYDEAQVVLLGHHAEIHAHFLEDLVQRDVADHRGHRTGFEAGKVEQLAEEGVERLDAFLDMRDAGSAHRGGLG